ncbi:unnamed protein product, partial [Linum tenue]
IIFPYLLYHVFIAKKRSYQLIKRQILSGEDRRMIQSNLSKRVRSHGLFTWQ